MMPVSQPSVRARWGFQEHLVRPDNAAFWVFVLLVALGGVIFVIEQLSFVSINPAGLILSWVLMVAYIVPVVLVLARLDLYEREPVSLMVGAFLWGALVAVAFAGIVNHLLGALLHGWLGGDVFFPWQDAIRAPIVEETYKYLGLVTLFLIAPREFDDLMDGFVYGALIGLGFAVTEDVFYFMSHFGGSIEGVLGGFAVRVIAHGLYTHVLFTGLAGIGFAYFVVHRHDRPFATRLGIAAGMLALAMFAHFVWNSPIRFGDDEVGILMYGVIKGAPFLLALAVAIRLAQRRERRWLEGALAPEVAAQVVADDDLRALTDGDLAKREREAVAGSYGARGSRVLKDLRREQINLAMVRARVVGDDDPDLVRQRAIVQSLRRQLDGLASGLDSSADGPAAEPATTASPTPWSGDVLVPEGGMTAWPVPDGASAGAVALGAGLPLRRVTQLGDWCHVEASNGWRGWVDGRRLVLAGEPPTAARRS